MKVIDVRKLIGNLVLAALLCSIGCAEDSNNNNSDGGSDGDTDTDVDTDTGEAPLKRVVAIGDNHADLSQALLALRVGGVIDESLNWIGEDTIVVQTGDILDRGVEEREVIDMYEELRPEAEAAGGQIINMSGNHEIMTAYADYRYVQEGACAAFSDLDGLDTSNPLFDEFEDENCKLRAAAFFPGGPYAEIISDWPVVTVVQDSVFVHGGLHQKHVDYGIDEINSMVETWLLGDGDLNYNMVGGGTDVYSVDWDRTYSDDEVPPTDEQCDALASVLDQLGVVRMAMGHTVHVNINAVCNDTAWRIDTGMSQYYGGTVQVLEILDGNVNILTELGG